MSKHAIVQPATLSVAVQFPPATITMTHHAWVTWAEIAIQQERLAKYARANLDVFEFRPGLVALTSSAFALDALYGVGKQLIPDPAGQGGRGARVGELLKRGVSPAKLGQKWRKLIRKLFQDRDEAVHFDEISRSPVWHPALNSNVDPLVLRWGAESATQAVDLLLEILGAWADHPSKHTADWAAAYTPSVRALESAR